MPFLASLPMGAAAFLIYRGVHALTRSIPGGNLIALVPAIAIGACIYFLIYLLISDPKAEDLAGLREAEAGGDWQKAAYYKRPFRR